MSPRVPGVRIRVRREVDIRGDGQYVLYWMIAARRLSYNYALQRALEIAAERKKPLVILEALRVGYPWASDRFHRFVLEGMDEHAHALAPTAVAYYPYVEPEAGAGQGLLAALAEDACAVVTDHFPCFFLPRMVDAASQRLRCRLEEVDSNGLVPLELPGKAFPTAHAFRRWLQGHVLDLLGQMATADPLSRIELPSLASFDSRVTGRWPLANLPSASTMASLPIDHDVSPVSQQGGTGPARRQLETFLSERLGRYLDRNQPEVAATSQLSAYLHFGHIAAQELLDRLIEHENWTPSRVLPPADGRRERWWSMSAPAEAWVDQLLTWRELGFNAGRWLPDFDAYPSLPRWARDTLEVHADDPRPAVYTFEQFEQAQTHDPLWNAAQNQLRSEGHIHNYLRMLWGKKILHWSRDPVEALEIMLHLNDKYALDGRDPNSISGIFWVLGRYDRPWGPERPVFGKIRYMSSANTARKIRVKEYVRRHQPATPL